MLIIKRLIQLGENKKIFCSGRAVKDNETKYLNKKQIEKIKIKLNKKLLITFNSFDRNINEIQRKLNLS